MSVLLMIYGLWRAVHGELMGGLWLVLIGLFIRNAARMSYQQHLMSRIRNAVGYDWGPRYGQGEP